MRFSTTHGFLVSVSASLVLSSCGFNVGNGLEASSVNQTTYGQAIKYSKVDVNANPLHKTVCDPFEGNAPTNLEHGIRASLHPLASNMPRLYSSVDYVNLASKSEQKLFFADLNVPTRLFQTGFSTKTNDVLKDDTGAKLIEYFGVKFETVIRLTPEDEEGDYELALLSDDGTTLKVVGGTAKNPVLETLIDNDGDHPTRMGCSNKLVSMNSGNTLPIQLTYYQGPRFHISNVLMWRKASAAGKDSQCGKSGNSLYFNPDKSSEPQQAYKDLLARGWKVVGKENFFMPKTESYNPCVEGTAPVISDFRVHEVLLTGAFLTWKTDIPSTSQVKLINTATGEVILTDSDNALRTTHEVQVSGLQPGSSYSAQAVSVSDNLGHAMSDIIMVFTP